MIVPILQVFHRQSLVCSVSLFIIMLVSSARTTRAFVGPQVSMLLPKVFAPPGQVRVGSAPFLSTPRLAQPSFTVRFLSSTPDGWDEEDIASEQHKRPRKVASSRDRRAQHKEEMIRRRNSMSPPLYHVRRNHRPHAPPRLSDLNGEEEEEAFMDQIYSGAHRKHSPTYYENRIRDRHSSRRRPERRRKNEYWNNNDSVSRNDFWEPEEDMYTSSERRGRRSSSYGSRDNRKNYGDNHRKVYDDDAPQPMSLSEIEGAGFVHIYGVSPVMNALENARRFLTVPGGVQEDKNSDSFDVDRDNRDDPSSVPSILRVPSKSKPQAECRPYLFLQSSKANAAASTKKQSGKAAHVLRQVTQLAQQRNIPVEYVDKGVLNSLCSNRPHQGMVLRCGKLEFQPCLRIPPLGTTPTTPSFWLVLDEVVDPQNFGALLRSAYFLDPNMGVLVCAKNSAPPSPVVSAASAGALERMAVVATNNLPRTLGYAQQDGFRIIGASSAVPSEKKKRKTPLAEEGILEEEAAASVSIPPPLHDLHQLLPRDPSQPTILVLGSEGHGLRTLVARACTEFVRISPSTESTGLESENSDDEEEDEDVSDSNRQDTGYGVDSLNVSVSGGIILWHLLRGGHGR
eukprot:Nitzschia sp. Nitz4//scaffold145_size56662//12795//14765//NITZ4_006553-RA/size56662-snap-gene-0.89-mRNA-1//-1//CDS//3329536565//5361//frame0